VGALMTYQIYLGDCMKQLSLVADKSVDAIITDPPYGLTSIVKRFGKLGSKAAKKGTDGRFTRLSSGFMGNQWDGSGIEYNVDMWKEVMRVAKPGAHLISFGGTRTYHRMACAIEDAGWEIRDCLGWIYGQGFPKSHDVGDGWGTALKPAFEPMILARVPLSEKTVKANIKKWKTGGINIESCRIPSEPIPVNKLEQWSGFGQKVKPGYKAEVNIKGRWPSNLLHDGSCNSFPQRFFYCPKVSKKERNEGIEDNTHPTLKPIALMQYLCRLITPINGTVLDPFMGSGSTGCAALLEGFYFIGIEIGKKYFSIAADRLAYYENKEN
jgi:site-specific DNA-methyltransferase (adenine-specific)